MNKGVILAIVTGSASDTDVLDTALALAGIHDSHIEVLHPRLDPYRLLAGFVDGINSLGTSEIIAGIRHEIDRRQHLAQVGFNAWTAAHGLRVGLGAASAAGSDAAPTTSWRLHEGTYEDSMTQFGRLADFVVTARPPGVAGAQDAVVKAAIFGAGRPVLCVPPGYRSLKARSAAILWNGSLEAARAVGCAIPLLNRCADVVVVTAGASDGADPTDLVERLVLRGIEARTRRVSLEQELAPTALLGVVNDGSFDFVVMGGYGHYRLREMILGSLTRDMLAEAKIPVLLAH